MSYTVSYVHVDGETYTFSDISSLYFNYECIELYRNMKCYACLPVQFITDISIKVNHD